MKEPEDRATTGPETGWRRWLPALAYGFVIFALVVMAVAPAVLRERVETTWSRFQRQVVPARDLVTELRFEFERQAAAVRGFVLSGDTSYLVDYRAARAAEGETFERLAPLARRIDPAVAARLDAVRRAADRWHVLEDSLVSGRVTSARFVARISDQEALHDATLAATAQLEAELRRTVRERAAALDAELVRQGAVSVALGLLALLAAALVGWFARRQRALSTALGRAVDQERQLREEAEIRRDDLERITESRGRLMRGFSHDVKNPLGAADGYLQLLEEGIVDRLTPKQKESVAMARRSLAAALHLIEDLLELARAESGRIEIEREPVDVRDVARDAAEEYRAQAEAKGLDMEVELPAEFPEIESDADRIRQVVSNLLSNAVKYTDRGGVTVRARVRSDGEAPGPGRWVAVEVADTGPGIPEDQRRFLFQEFARVSAGAGRRGAGIGLAIGRRIARRLGGDITFETEPGRGSTFTLWLPLAAREGERPMAAD